MRKERPGFDERVARNFEREADRLAARAQRSREVAAVFTHIGEGTAARLHDSPVQKVLRRRAATHDRRAEDLIWSSEHLRALATAIRAHGAVEVMRGLNERQS
ncbi:MAG: hypothetical protein ACRDM0_01090 [Thermoleophilaceae bacterium]